MPVAVLFVVRWVGSFLVPARSPIPDRDGTLGGAVLGVVAHLLLFPIVAALPAPTLGAGGGLGLARDRHDQRHPRPQRRAQDGLPAAALRRARLGGPLLAGSWRPASDRPAGRARLRRILVRGAVRLLCTASGLLRPAWFLQVGRCLAAAERPPPAGCAGPRGSQPCAGVGARLTAPIVTLPSERAPVRHDCPAAVCGPRPPRRCHRATAGGPHRAGASRTPVDLGGWCPAGWRRGRKRRRRSRRQVPAG